MIQITEWHSSVIMLMFVITIRLLLAFKHRSPYNVLRDMKNKMMCLNIKYIGGITLYYFALCFDSVDSF